MKSHFDGKPEDFPCTVTLRFKNPNEAEEALHDLETSARTLSHSEHERGKNIYYVENGFPDPDFG